MYSLSICFSFFTYTFPCHTFLWCQVFHRWVQVNLILFIEAHSMHLRYAGAQTSTPAWRSLHSDTFGRSTIIQLTLCGWRFTGFKFFVIVSKECCNQHSGSWHPLHISISFGEIPRSRLSGPKERGPSKPVDTSTLLFMWLFAICMFLSVKCLLMFFVCLFFAHFQIGLYAFNCWVLRILS